MLTECSVATTSRPQSLIGGGFTAHFQAEAKFLLQNRKEAKEVEKAFSPDTPSGTVGFPRVISEGFWPTTEAGPPPACCTKQDVCSV